MGPDKNRGGDSGEDGSDHPDEKEDGQGHRLTGSRTGIAEADGTGQNEKFHAGGILFILFMNQTK